MSVSVSIEKSVIFQGRRETFSNVYRYEVPQDDEQYLTSLADAVMALERLVHSTDVRFDHARVWGTGIPPNYMHVSKAYTNVNGSSTPNPLYRECAILIKWPLPRKFGLNRSVTRSLKKWLHSCSYLGIMASGDGTAMLSNPGAGSNLETYLQGIQTPVTGAILEGPDGTKPTGGAVLHPYLEHRQFPRGKKEGLI